MDLFLEEKGSTTNGIDKDNKNQESDEHKENFDKHPNQKSNSLHLNAGVKEQSNS